MTSTVDRRGSTGSSQRTPRTATGWLSIVRAMRTSCFTRSPRLAVIACGALLFVGACGSADDDAAGETSATAASDVTSSSTSIPALESTTTTASGTTSSTEEATSCDDISALFVTRGSANADLDDPAVDAACDGDALVVTSNAIPDYTYVETSPGNPRAQDYTFTIPATPTVAEGPTDVPVIGVAAVTLSGIPIFGPTEGTGGDVDSLPGIISECGSHNGPSGFHIHKIMTSANTDCLFTPDEVAAAPQLVGYAFDGFPIYTGADQYTSSWELTDETLFATDTWAAHTYVEGLGDLDRCNGLTDAEGNYAYYTTDTFPYVLGCYTGVVDLDAAGAGGGGGDRPERPAGTAEGGQS